MSLTPVQYACYPTTDIRHILPRLTPSFAKVASSRPGGESTKSAKMVQDLQPKGDQITHKWFWPRMGKWFADNGGSQLSTPTGTVRLRLRRHHHHRDGYIRVRTTRCAPAVACDVRRPDPVGFYRLVSRCGVGLFPRGIRGKASQDGALRRRRGAPARESHR